MSAGYHALALGTRAPLEQAGGLLALTLALTPAAWLLLQRVIRPRLQDLPARLRLAWLAGTLLASAFLIAAIPLPSPARWRTLEIVATGDKNPESGGRAVIVWAIFRAGGARVPLAEYELHGAWETGENDLVVAWGRQPATLRWRTTSGQTHGVDLPVHPNGGIMILRWKGEEYVVDLYSADERAKPIRATLIGTPREKWDLPAGLAAGLFAADLVFLGLPLLALGLWLVARDPAPAQPAARRRGAWAMYALPCLAVWSVYLLAFYPALMSVDSIDHWTQAVGRGNLWDPHPPLYTLFLWLTAHLGGSPAAAAILQMVATALLLAYGWETIEQAGTPRRVTGALAVLAAALPVTGATVVTIWKDVPFSLSMLGLTLILIKMAAQPATAGRAQTWVLIGLLCAALMLLRNNGLLIGFGLLLLISLSRLRHWPLPLAAAGVCLAVFWLFHSVVYDALRVERMRWQYTLPFVHHIGAHLAAGTPLNDDEQALVSSIWDIGGRWEYSETFAGREFDFNALNRRAGDIPALWLRLTQRNPAVTLRHLYWSSMLVWVVSQPSKGWLVATPVQEQLIAPNAVGLEPARPFPALTSGLVELIDYSLAPQRNFIWRPAGYLYVSLFAIVIGCLRRRQSAWLQIAAPIALLSASLLFSTINQEMRFMYPVQLASFVLAGLMFLPRAAPGPQAEGRRTETGLVGPAL